MAESHAQADAGWEAAGWAPNEASPTLSRRGQSLLLPTNPNVHPDVDPTQDTEYVNPVTLNNRTVLYGNATVQATDELTAFNRKVEAAKLAKRKAERALEAFERRVLRQFPTPRGVTTLKAIEAHIEKMAREVDETGDQLEELREAVHHAEDAVHYWQSRAENARLWLDAIKTGSQNITTHLSWKKFEAGHR